jgi:chemotaxis protein methyltransferase CheR
MSDQLTDYHYRRLAHIIENHVGIRLPPAKRTMVEGRLRKRVRALGLTDVNEYCRRLFDDGALESEFVHVIDLVTTNKTDFFREPEHFDYLRSEGVPQLLAAPRGGRRAPLKVWSAACSNGAEPYTIAMVLADLALEQAGLQFSILGTDISTEMLRQAETAIYPEDMMAPVPPELHRRYVMRARDPERRVVRIVPELRRLFRCQRLNLMDRSYPVPRDMDILFCRNVLIYFDRPTQQAVLQRLCDHLRPGGYLFLGHSESAAGSASTALRQVGPTIFRRG